MADSLRESVAPVHAPASAQGRLARRIRAAPVRYPRMALAILVALLGVSGLAGTPPVDRDEPQFTQPARQMLASGDFVDIRFQNEPLAQKPVLTYWLEAGSAAIFGGPSRAQIWAYRLPSVLAVLAATLLTLDLAATLFGRAAGFPAALLVGTSVLVQSQAHQARADALLLATMLMVTLPLARAWLAEATAAYEKEASLAALFWIAMAAAMLTKGPVVPALILPAVAVLGWQRRSLRWLRHLRPSWGIPLFLFVLLPWPLAVLWHRGPSLFIDAWRTDILPKIVSGQESHGAPPLTYLLTSPLTLWPASLLLPAALEYGWRRRRDAAVVFCAAMVLPGWLLFEAAPTKLPHYIMPFIPLLAGLMAAACVQPDASRPSAMARRVGVVFLMLGAVLATTAVALSLLRLGPGLGIAAVVWIMTWVIAVGWAAVTTWHGPLGRAIGGAALSGAVASLVVFGFTLPRLDRLWVAERAAQASRIAAPAPARIVVTGYEEPSLVFLLGTSTRFADAAGAATALGSRAAAAAIVSGRSSPAFLAAARRGHFAPRRVADIRGIDPVHGRPVELGVWIR